MPEIPIRATIAADNIFIRNMMPAAFDPCRHTFDAKPGRVEIDEAQSNEVS